MRSVFEKVREDSGEPYCAVPFAAVFAASPALLDRCAAVAAVLKTHFLTGKGWRFRVHEASLTFYQVLEKHRAVKILIDAGKGLARKAGIPLRHTAVVIGVELSHVNPYVRELIRNDCAARFGELYLDPRAPRSDSFQFISNDKYWINPQNEHFYDLVFIDDGQLPFPVDPSVTADFRRRITRGLKLNPRTLQPS